MSKCLAHRSEVIFVPVLGRRSASRSETFTVLSFCIDGGIDGFLPGFLLWRSEEESVPGCTAYYGVENSCVRRQG